MGVLRAEWWPPKSAEVLKPGGCYMLHVAPPPGLHNALLTRRPAAWMGFTATAAATAVILQSATCTLYLSSDPPDPPPPEKTECGCCGPMANHGLYGNGNANEQAQFEQAQSCYEVTSTDAVLGEYDGGAGESFSDVVDPPLVARECFLKHAPCMVDRQQAVAEAVAQVAPERTWLAWVNRASNFALPVTISRNIDRLRGRFFAERRGHGCRREKGRGPITCLLHISFSG